MSEERSLAARHDVVTSEELHGEAVYDPQGKRLGKISTLVVDKVSGRVVSVVLVVSGFLGLGHSHRDVPWSSLKYDRSLNGFVTDSASASEPPRR